MTVKEGDRDQALKDDIIEAVLWELKLAKKIDIPWVMTIMVKVDKLNLLKEFLQ